MMLKIEQERIDWWADFSVLADQYVDRKVRQSLRSKRFSAGTNYQFTSSSDSGPGKGLGGSNYSSQNHTGKDQSLHSVICWQWNYSFCSYGDNCKRWHACRTCAEAGKLGETHKASSHEDSSLRAKPGEPRI